MDDHQRRIHVEVEMTKSNKTQQNAKKKRLTDRQLKAIPIIVTSPTYSEGCKKAKLNRTTFYEWLKIPEFKTELDRQRNEIAAEAFGTLSQGLTKAVETLVGLLDHKDDRLKRLTAKDIIDHYLKHKELHELEERIEAIEKRLEGQRR
jgi:hypothetical protein